MNTHQVNSRGTRALIPLILLAVAQMAGAQVPNRVEPLPGVTTAGQPDRAGLEQIADEGIVAVIDLRTAGEDRGLDEAGVVEALGMRYVSLPVGGLAGITYENASALDALLAEIDGPVLVHCSTGNRAGALLALRARMHGESVADALALGEQGGISRADVRDAVESKLRER